MVDVMSFFFLEKVELFLELFGNSLIRPLTNEFLQQRAKELITYVTPILSRSRECNCYSFLMLMDLTWIKAIMPPILFSKFLQWHWINNYDFGLDAFRPCVLYYNNIIVWIKVWFMLQYIAYFMFQHITCFMLQYFGYFMLHYIAYCMLH